MRQDMQEVLDTRARYRGHSCKGDMPRVTKKDIEEGDLPFFEGNSTRTKHGRKTKSRGYYTSPLLRFLASRVGKPWNDTYSEIKRVCKKDKGYRHSIDDKLGWEVETHVFMRDGVPYVAATFGGKEREARFCYSPYWVHPETNILHKTEKASVVKDKRPICKTLTEVRVYAQGRRCREIWDKPFCIDYKYTDNCGNEFERFEGFWFKLVVVDSYPEVVWVWDKKDPENPKSVPVKTGKTLYRRVKKQVDGKMQKKLDDLVKANKPCRSISSWER